MGKTFEVEVTVTVDVIMPINEVPIETDDVPGLALAMTLTVFGGEDEDGVVVEGES